MYTLQQIAEITNTKFFGKNNYSVSHYLNDSRGLHSAEETIFIALKTQRNNGHLYIPELIESGLKSFLVAEGEFDYSDFKDSDVSFIVSEDPLHTIQILASYHRQRFSIPVIGITGSHGKTVVKEWLYQLLKNDFAICRSPKSYNSQIGVPLSVLNLNETHTLGIFEAGISKEGEMERLASIIRPTLGVLTSFGSPHDEGFLNREQKMAEKLKLVSSSDKIILSGITKNDAPQNLKIKALFISEHADADLKISFESDTLYLQSSSTNYKFKIPFTDQASIHNIATCVGVLLTMGFQEQVIQSRISLLQPVALRLEIKNGIQNSLLINDYYNSDLDSLKIALNYLQQQNRRLKKIVIVSDIEQSGIPSSALYRKLADLFQQNRIDLVVGIGNEISNHRPLFKANSLFFRDTQEFASQFYLNSFHFSDAGILLKGARSFGFENISKLLQLKSHDTVFEINLNKLTDNINYYRSLLAPKVQMMGMVKAMGYGSGSAEVGRTLQHMGVNYLAVAYADEGVELRASHITLPIMVMNPEEDAFEDIINHRLEPEIYHYKLLKTFVAKLDALGITEPYPVHLKIDTGMHRLGFEEHELIELAALLKQNPLLKVKSVFSHLVGSDNAELDGFTKEQVRIFEKAFQLIEEQLGYSVIKHLCNSGGITRFKQAHYDMVRLGIGMYGIGVNAEEQKQLQNVGTLKTKISQIKKIKAGDTVGYNRNGKISQDTSIATIPIGYADGFSRQLGNANHGVYVNGIFCKTVGNICMDMCMIDITGISCSEGEEVIIFENDKQIAAIAKAMNSISYEVLTNVSGRVKRIYVQE
ncbi:bifunctional UDP-N-acetylmuramoyl-tripeptide:D-alanyl-D-alanine ligase/alanine racemase [Sphingobacteriaceae bacterium]|nr:bifunctional UDP-N-acetylmuramoyl-tripeptide:D-alanyl-D-alanine ligase/alanine racemase [Sphingobacteriaceae bacterium]